jgi:multidrug efflux system membrane fusion protein
MRIVPILTAAVVMALTYMFIMERSTLLSLVGVEPAAAAAEPVAPPPEAEDPRFAVVVQRLTERELESAVILRGRTEASRQVEVRAQTSGLVISQPVPRGSAVAEGDLLCRLDPATRAASLAEAEARVTEAEARQAEAAARLAEAEINFTTTSRLTEGGFGAQNRLASAEAALQTARAGVEAARAGVEAARTGVEAARTELSRLDIAAPFAGVIEDNSAETGSLMAQGGLCATVIQLDPMRVVAFAAESQIDRLVVGAMAGARLSNGTEVMGQVTFLARVADPQTRTFRVEMTVPNPDLSIRQGMSADMMIAATATRGHLVPGSALTIRDDGALGLRLVDAEGVTFFQPVTVLRDAPAGFWVSGLPEVADVIVVGQEYVIDGIPVRVVMQGEE